MVRKLRLSLSSKHKFSICLIIPLILATAVLLLNPAKSLADSTRAKNVGRHDYWNWRNWAENTYSYLTATSDGYMVFEGNSNGDDYLVEYYDSSFKLKSTTTVPCELPLFGAFYSDGSNYYILSGQSNTSESASVECYRVTKYSTSWSRLGSCGLKDCNTYNPFEAGSASMASTGSRLIVRTCHKMYQSADDGLRHQSNVTFLVNTSSMTITDSQYSVSSCSTGYSSHSFNQYVRFDGNHVVGADHGDAYPRAMAVFYYTTDVSNGKFLKNYYSGATEYDVLTISGSIGDNYTYATLGGLEVTGSSYLIAGSSIAQGGSSSTKNVFVGAVAKSGGSTSLKWITSYGSDDSSAGNPFLVKISNSKLAVIWEKDGKVCYQFIDGSGNKSGSTYSANAFLSDCQPIVSGGKIIWYTYDGTTVNFFSINTSDGTFTSHSPVDLSHTTLTAIGEQTYTGSAITPALTLTYGDKTLVKDTDYTVAYTNNTSYGTATVTITGKGSFTGTKSATFKIVRKDINSLSLSPIADAPYAGGSSVIPNVVLKHGNKTLTKDTDYSLTCSNNYNLGTATVKITGKGNYTGTITTTFNIVQQSAANLSYVLADQEYTGSELTPNPTIKNGTRTLSKGTDYTVTYSNNTEIGTASAVITFTGNYTGTKTLTFKITKRQMSNCYAYVYSQTYTGAALTPKPTVYTTNSSSSPKLVEGTDYTLSYKNNVEIGTATVVITGIGTHHTGTKELNFKINPVSVSQTTITYTVTTFYYTGSAIEPEFTLKYGDLVFEAGTDYTYTVSNNVEPGSAKITITGISDRLTGTYDKTFYINKISIGSLTIDAIPDQYYTGSAIEPAVVVKNGSTTLVEGTDYTVTYSNNTNITSYAYAYVTGTGHYSGSKSVYFRIVKKSVADATYNTIAAQTYTGSAIQPAVTVKFNGTTLVKDTDYTVSYGTNTSAGTGYIYIYGTGLYSGSKTITFTISPKSAANTTVSTLSNYTYDGAAKKPAPTIKDGSKTLSSGIDYTLSYSDNTNAGTATVTITFKGNYTGSKTANFTISPKTLSNSAVSSIAAQAYTGSAITPSVTVKDGTKVLTSGTDYTVAYSNNTNAGTATATITCKGNYSGTLTKTFTISASTATLTISTIADQTYTGAALTPAVTVKAGSKTLVAGTDYTVTYSNNVNAGLANVTVNGKGNYSSYAYANFTIVPKSLSGATVASISDMTYTGSSIKPGVTVKDGSKTLVSGTDYSLSYSNNLNVGTATVTITGKGNYTGTLTKTFKIVADTTGFTISDVSEQTYTGSAITPAVTVKSGSTTLTAGTDYTIAYTNNINAGTATITVTGKGNYSGSKTKNFTIAAKSISGMTATVAAQTYSGAALTPSVTVKDGSKTLTAGTDYTVAYANNVNAGTATATVTGKGNYKGSISATFEIKANSTSFTVSSISDQVYTGAEIKPSITVKVGSKTLTLGTDYTLSYSNNINAGTGSIKISGKGNYSASKTVSFAILPKSISSATIATIPDQPYTGSEVTPSLNVKDGSKALIKGTDYTVTYADNINEGTATVTITGMGNYTGTKTATFVIDKEAEPIKTGWQQEDGKWYLYDMTGTKVTGFAENGGKTYYMNADGVMQTRWVEIENEWYYFNGSGAMMTGWQQISNKWYYLDPETGVMVTGWFEDGGDWYYLKPGSGAMLTSWQQIEGTWYCFDYSGKMKTGWIRSSGIWYYLNSSGAMLTGWQRIDDVWYFLDEDSGAMQTGWLEDGGSTYYLKSSGAMATKWEKIDGDWYWFGSNGVMVYSTSIVDGGKTYNFNEKGVCTNP